MGLPQFLRLPLQIDLDVSAHIVRFDARFDGAFKFSVLQIEQSFLVGIFTALLNLRSLHNLPVLPPFRDLASFRQIETVCALLLQGLLCIFSFFVRLESSLWSLVFGSRGASTSSDMKVSYLFFSIVNEFKSVFINRVFVLNLLRFLTYLYLHKC